MLGFFFRHYDDWVDRYVVYDDGSTDGSLDILRKHPKVEVRSFERRVADSFCLSHTVMQDQAWKESRGRADWIVVTAIDEHLHVRGRSMGDYLQGQAAAGTTLIPALGFDMNHPTMVDDHGLLVERITCGRARPAFNKLSIFDPAAIVETGFAPGRHAAEPIGVLRLPPRDEVVLWHYKHLGFERNAEREREQSARLGSGDVRNGLGQHYLRSRESLRLFWDDMEAESTDLALADLPPERICARPLWWEQRPSISRPRHSHASEASRPTLSVLIKCYNHASYIRQTLDSVLAQSFQDFEVLVLDDASSDASASIAHDYAKADPRIIVEGNERNGGISAAMNKLLAKARGRYLAILNSDDFALPFRFERQVAALDADSEIDALFGLPQLVDELGTATDAHNPFRAAFDLPDFSSRSWLGHFFLRGNCLCAPSAMIRRSAYDRVGSYDERLHNLQDFDMWVRMAKAGLGLHVTDEATIAFRIRDAQGNASAASPSTLLRSAFETLQILDHYRRMEQRDLARIFHFPADENCRAALGRLALESSEHGLALFGLQLLYDEATSEEECRDVIRLSGRTDIFNVDRCDHYERRANDLARMLRARDLRDEGMEGFDPPMSRPRPSRADLTGQRLVVSGTSDIWLIFHGYRHKIQPAAHRSLFAAREQRCVDSIDHILRSFDIEDGACLARGEDAVETYLVCPSKNRTCRYLIAESAWDAFGFDGRKVSIVPRAILDSIARGSDIVLREADEDWASARAARHAPDPGIVGRLKGLFQPFARDRQSLSER